MQTHRKGREWRRQVQDWLDAQGFATTFRPVGEPGDDVTAVRGPLVLSIEAKNQKEQALASWVDQAEGNAGPEAIPVVVAHRRGRSTVEASYVILSGAAFRRLLDRLP